MGNKKYICHYGIKGQEWGVTMGPPYPLDEDERSAKEKREARFRSRKKTITENGTGIFRVNQINPTNSLRARKKRITGNAKNEVKRIKELWKADEYSKYEYASVGAGKAAVGNTLRSIGKKPYKNYIN